MDTELRRLTDQFEIQGIGDTPEARSVAIAMLKANGCDFFRHNSWIDTQGREWLLTTGWRSEVADSTENNGYIDIDGMIYEPVAAHG